MKNKGSRELGRDIIISTPSDLIDTKCEGHQLICGSKYCPSCGYKLDIKPNWVGLPAGVKFDPTDQELIEHLEAKVHSKSSTNNKSHPLIDEFIPTIDGDDGICYTHPEKLPGVTRDGLSRHFFHRPSKAYTTGTRKRRKIQTESDLNGATAGETRWHKTGKTRPVMVNGKHKGCKKILVLYTNFGKNRKPEKTNWVMHQYHLGQNEEEKEGELVVSKIFYQTQPRQCNWAERSSVASTNTAEASTSSSRVVVANPATRGVEVIGGGMASFGGMDHHHHHAQHYRDHDHHMQEQFMRSGEHLIPTFVPFAKNFDDQTAGDQTVAAATSATATYDEPDMIRLPHHPQMDAATIGHEDHHMLAAAAFHVSRPSHPISHMISPPQLHHASLIFDDHQLMLHSEHNFLEETEEQHHKIGGRSASGLEEIIMACASSSPSLKHDSSMRNTQEADQWLKYSPFWHHPDNPDHHG